MAKQVTESDYRTAQQGNARVRQEFLDAVEFGEDRRLFDRVIYNSSQEFGRYLHSCENTPTRLAFAPIINFKNSTVKTRPIKVYPEIFKMPFGYFMNSTLRHEIHHARQLDQNPESFIDLAFGICLMASEYCAALIEIPAHLNQTIPGKEFPLSKRRLAEVEKVILILETKMKEEAAFLDFDWASDLSRSLLPSPHDDIVRQRYNIN